MPLALDFSGKLRECRRRAAEEDDMRPLACETQGGGAANAAPGPGDDGDLVLDAHIMDYST